MLSPMQEEKIMSKLTDSQLIILSAAAARADEFAIAPAKMNRAAAMKVGASLVARQLMREVKAKPGMPAWREDAKGHPVSLMITAAGRKAIGVDDRARKVEAAADGVSVCDKRGVTNRADKSENKALATRSRAKTEQRPKTSASPEAKVGAALVSPRAGSKQALLIEMLRAKTGATLDALVDATGWLPHTTRAALTGLRKRGYAITRGREGDASVYRIVEAAAAVA